MAERAVAFAFQAAGTQTWTADEDVILSYVMMSTVATGVVFVTTDPSLTAALVTAPTATKMIDLLWVQQGNGKNHGSARVRVPSGTPLLIVSQVQTTAVLFFESALPDV